MLSQLSGGLVRTEFLG